MKVEQSLTLLSLLLPFALCQRTVDVVFVNGTIHTLDAQSSVFSPGSLAYSNGTIACVGSDADVRTECPFNETTTRVINLEGRTLIPGLIDAHMHPVQAARGMLGCSLQYRKLAEQELINIVQACVDRNANASDAETLSVTEWDREAFTDRVGSINATMLDKVRTRRPIIITATSQHSVWVNTRALNDAGINSATSNPAGGVIGRDTNGFPTGVLEENASNLVRNVASAIPEDIAARLALAHLAKSGITTFMDALATPTDIWRNLSQQNELTARVWNCIGVFGAIDPAAFAQNARQVSASLDDGPLRPSPSAIWKHIKMFVDGVPSQVSSTAFLLEPYLVDSGNGTFVPGSNRGLLNVNQTTLRETLVQVLQANIGIHLHGDGDGAVRNILDVIESLDQPLSPNQIAIAHGELVNQTDFARFGDLNTRLIMSYQWAQKASFWNVPTQRSIGPVRMQQTEPFGLISELGQDIVYGSDWPVDPLDPFLALKIGVTRAGDPSNPNSHANFSQEFVGRLDNQPGLSRESAIRGMTSIAADWLNATDKIGSLEVGKFADMVVLERPYFDKSSVADEDLGRNKVLLTVVGGRPIFSDASASFVPLGWCTICQNQTAILAAAQPANIVPRHISKRSCGGHSH